MKVWQGEGILLPSLPFMLVDAHAPPSAARPLQRWAHPGFVVAVAILAGLVQWLATAPRWLVHINWDAGSYLHQIAMGRAAWSSPTWTAHAGLQYLYLAACALVRVFHGTPADGFRFLNTVGFALLAGMLADAGLRLTRSRLLAALLVLVWATAFVTQFLSFTLEDNLVFLTPAMGMLWLCAVRASTWGARESLVGGLIAAAAGILSIQGVLYLLPPLYLAAILPRPGLTLRRRAWHSALVLAGLGAGIAGFVLFFLATTSLGWRPALAHLLARPTSTLPGTRAALVAQVLDLRAAARTVGIATSLHLFRNRLPFATPAALVGIGGTVLAVEVGVAALATWHAVRTRQWAVHFFAVLLLAMTVMTSLYRDVEYAYLKRTDFAPIFLVFILMAVASGGTRLVRRLLGVCLALIVAWQVSTGLRWRRHEVATYETLDTTLLGRRQPGYHGLATGGSFLRHFRQLHEANPRACAFVLDFSEVGQGRWNPDLTGCIWSELPRHWILAAPSEMAGWPRPLQALDPTSARKSLTGCEWLSEAAKRRLDAASP
jgi:hypothetical protein